MYRFQRVTLTISPTSSLMRASSVHGGLIATAHPCDQSGIQDPVAGFFIVYVRVLARFSSFCAICSNCGFTIQYISPNS